MNENTASLTGVKTLIIGCMWPESTSSAAGSYLLQMIEQLQCAGCELHFASHAVPSERRDNLSSKNIIEHYIQLNDASFDGFIRELNPEIVIFDRFMTEEQFGWRVEKYAPNALRVLQTSDLHCLRTARENTLKTRLKADKQQGPVLDDGEQLAQLIKQEPLALREITSLLHCDLNIMISKKEIDLLMQQFNFLPEQLCYCPFLLQPNNNFLPFDARADFVTIGNFLHAPNWDSVQWLAHTLWPLIRKQLPTANLHVYGAYAPVKAKQLHKPQQGFLLHGFADDAEAVMQTARVCLAPLRFGAGIKGKLADAFVTGTPNVTTSIGAEGMFETIWPGLIADTIDELVAACVTLYSDQHLWQEKQAACLPIITQQFNPTVQGATFIDALTQAYVEKEQRRAANFWGRLISQNHLRATEYMARWIEAKNINKENFSKDSLNKQDRP